MKKYSKCAIYSLEQFENEENGKFYVAKLVENTYNPKIPYKNKWEYTFYKCQIYTDLPLEIANFDLELDKNKMNFINISNPEHSIIRVLDFEYVNRTQWKGKNQVKNDLGKPIYNQYIAINKCEFDYQGYKTEERKDKELQTRLEHFKEKSNSLTKENRRLTLMNARNEETILRLKEEIKSYKKEEKNIEILEKQFENVKFKEI